MHKIQTNTVINEAVVAYIDPPVSCFQGVPVAPAEKQSFALRLPPAFSGEQDCGNGVQKDAWGCCPHMYCPGVTSRREAEAAAAGIAAPRACLFCRLAAAHTSQDWRR